MINLNANLFDKICLKIRFSLMATSKEKFSFDKASPYSLEWGTTNTGANHLEFINDLFNSQTAWKHQMSDEASSN